MTYPREESSGEINKTKGISIQNILYKFCKIFLALIEKVVI